ncbi:MAG TPA: inorganic diphosphatase [Capsulimonadaceae bacterium]|jgi:inorganic pyrophosphatase
MANQTAHPLLSHYLTVPIGPNAPDEVRTIIEVPKGSSNKYRYHPKAEVFRYDRTLYSPLFYPYDYGWICGTKSPAYDRPLNCLVIAKNPTFTGCLIEARPIATLKMSDDLGYDPKVLCVAISDPRLEGTVSMEDVSEHTLIEVQHFFEIYQSLERREVKIEGWADTAATLELIQSAMLTGDAAPKEKTAKKH